MAGEIITQLEKKRKRLLYQAKWRLEHKDRIKKYPSMQKRRGIRKPVLRDTPCKRGHIAMRDSHGYCRKCKKESEKKSPTFAARANGQRERSRAKRYAYGAKRRAQKISATPPWFDNKKVTEIFEECERISKESSVIHHVDHIVPLMGKNVCGLHVHYNLQIITAEENHKKHNRHECD